MESESVPTWHLIKCRWGQSLGERARNFSDKLNLLHVNFPDISACDLPHSNGRISGNLTNDF